MNSCFTNFTYIIWSRNFRLIELHIENDRTCLVLRTKDQMELRKINDKFI